MMNDFNRANIGRMIAGDFDFFTAHLVRLIKRADFENRAKLRMAYPEDVDAVIAWETSPPGRRLARQEDIGAAMDVTERPDRFEGT